MVKVGAWRAEVRVGGTALKEHDIEGHAVVGAVPAREFEVQVETDDFDGLYLVECHIDGKQTTSRRFVDPARQTSRGGSRHITFKHFTKSAGDQQVQHAFAFASISTNDDDEGGSSRPAAMTWEMGKIDIKIFQGVKATLTSDARTMEHSADLRRRDDKALDEKTMIKNGLSVAAGAGSTTFASTGTWRAGESYVARAAGDPLVASLSIFYRDSFFLALREDTCCGGACALSGPSSSTLRDAASELPASDVRNSVVRERETRERLAQKRPRDEEPIDLCSDED